MVGGQVSGKRMASGRMPMMKGALLTFSMIAAYAMLLIITAVYMTAPAPGACARETCDSLGYVCGSWDDGCGGKLECGGCSGDDTCIEGACEAPDECTPKTCNSLGYDCGDWDDGCDGTLDCGDCYGGKKCIQGACVAPGSCTPLSCAIMGHSCGTWWDGCGETISCGTCTGTDTCINGQCVSACYSKKCGAPGYRCGTFSDGCGGNINCGNCDDVLQCVDGECIAKNCIPSCACAATTCAGNTCSNGCGGTCSGTLSPDCIGRVCGPAPNGCGGASACGNCTGGTTCSQGTCRTGPCTKSCAGKECGDDGCEGLCGRCQDVQGSNPCNGGLCNPYCNQNWGNCDDNRTNGCETNLLNNEQHCGSCDAAPCATGYACTFGVCMPGCSPKSCGVDYECGNWDTGCSPPQPLYCGGCTPPQTCNTTGWCTGGCTADCACAAQYCLGQTCPNGCGGICEGTLTLPADCGSRTCGMSPHSCGPCGDCEQLHSTNTCLPAGVCSPACDSGWGNCDDNAANGCETNLTATVNCGLCGTLCTNDHGTTRCTGAGVCSATCSAGYGSCDGNATNGCETALNTNINCGSCGSACNAGAGYSCQGGSGTWSCQVDNCPAGTANCTSGPVMCETNILTNTSHCGGCGIACTNARGTTACSGGVCTPACSSGWADCDGNTVNGCETPCASGVCSGGTCMTADLMLHYTFESISGGTVQDQGTYNNDGTVYGNPQLQTGVFGYGLHFDGSGDYVDAGVITPTGTALTLTAWFKADTIPTGFDPRIVSKAQSRDYQDWELQLSHYGFPEYRVRLTGESDMTASRVYNSSKNIETGKWYFVAGVFDGSTGKLYINCEEVVSKARSGSLLGTSSRVWVGDVPPATGNRPFTGTIDDVRVYLRALTPNEIGTLYSQCTTCSPCIDPSMSLPPPPLA